jgi:hypothetical protein
MLPNNKQTNKQRILLRKLHVVAHVCNPKYLGGGGRRIMSSRPAQVVVKSCLKKKIKAERGRGIAQW